CPWTWPQAPAIVATSSIFPASSIPRPDVTDHFEPLHVGKAAAVGWHRLTTTPDCGRLFAETTAVEVEAPGFRNALRRRLLRRKDLIFAVYQHWIFDLDRTPAVD